MADRHDDPPDRPAAGDAELRPGRVLGFDTERVGEVTEHRVVRLADLGGAASTAAVVSLHDMGGLGEQASVVEPASWRRDPADVTPAPDGRSGAAEGHPGVRAVEAPRPTVREGQEVPTADSGASRRRPAVRPALRAADDHPGSVDESTDDAVGKGGTGSTVRSTGGRRRTTGTDEGRTSGRPRAARAGGGRGPSTLDADEDPVVAARAICLRLLSDRARTRQELASALARRGVPDEAADTVLERFDEVGLIDDAAFAGQWVRARHARRGLARRAIAVELRRKGVADDVAQEALTEVDVVSEERRARELVDRKLRTTPTDTPDQRETATRRLAGMLARRGYPSGIVYTVIRAALAALGGDDEFDPAPDL